MSADPAVVDTNILVYAMDADAPQHTASRALLQAAYDQSVKLYVTSQVLCEFYSIVTNPRRVPNPRTSGEARDVINQMLAFLQVLPAPADTVKGWMDLLTTRRVTGSDIFDLQLVAVMLANNINQIYAYNTPDFTPFQKLTVKEP